MSDDLTRIIGTWLVSVAESARASSDAFVLLDEAAAIAAVEAEERGMKHWVDLTDRLTREAALRAVPREDEDVDG